jgi:dipeptidyl aminopeptidase/acylaminoacyl peptidase
MHTVEDPRVYVMQSLAFATALQQHGVPFEVHIYEKGRHGIALGKDHPWPAECIRWLRERFQ